MTVGFALIVAIICGVCVFAIVSDFRQYEKERAERIETMRASLSEAKQGLHEIEGE